MSDSYSEGIRLLSFDGGDRRAVSQLMVLDEFMRRVGWDRKSEARILPCDYFHMMAGVGTGGIIVILLAVLRMEISETIDTFLDIWQTVFTDGGLDKVARSQRLESKMQDLLRKKGMKAGRKLLIEEKEENSCKAFVCITAEASFGLCRKSRNYSSENAPHDPTVVQAARATCAMPMLFTPVTIESTAYVTGSFNFNNPAGELIREACEYFGNHRPVASLLSLGCSRRTVHRMSKDTQEMDINALITENTSDGEIVDRELGWRIGKSKVYCRLTVEGFKARSDSDTESISDITSCTNIFLEHYDTGEKINRCVRLSEHVGRLALKDIAGLSEERSTSMHGLPPLSAFFVERPELIGKMHDCLFRAGPTAQKRMVLSGLGGIGKTQITISFMLQFLSRFRHVLFIDASSVQSIESSIILKVKLLGASYARTTAVESLQVLANPDHEITRDWAIVYDNVDDSNINIAHYFPQCTFGTIFITTRNPNLGNLAPAAHLQLDVMSEEEAVNVLLRSAVLAPRTPTETDEMHARAIAKELGYLPVALVQAGYFIKVHDCMHGYLQRLQERRLDILNRPARDQLDDHYHGVYATLNVTWPHLSPRAQSFLSILGFFKYTGFPLVLIYGAAILRFQREPWNFVNRPALFQDTVQLLCDTFIPRENWNEQDVDDLVAELERYSLVTRMSTFMVTTLRLHPLVHSWILDRLSSQERERYQAAAVRLLVCGSGDEDEDIHEFIYPHVGLFSGQIKQLLINDRAGIANIYARQGQYKTATVLWEGIWSDIGTVPVKNELVTSEVKLRLAALLWEPIHEHDLCLADRELFHPNTKHNYSLEYRNQILKAVEMEQEAVECRTKLLGDNHPMTVKANLQLARGIARHGKKDLAITMLRGIIRFWEEKGDETWEEVVKAKEELATVCPKSESVILWAEVIQERSERRSQEHHTTLKAIEALARSYRKIAMFESEDRGERLRHYASATELWSTLVATRTRRRGIQHPDTLNAMEGLARSYWLQRCNNLSVEVWEQVKDLRRGTQGNNHRETLSAMEELAKRYAWCQPPRLQQAEALWKELIYLREESQGSSHDDTLQAMRNLADMYAEAHEYNEAECQWMEVINRKREKHGQCNERTIIAVTELARMYKRSKRDQQAEVQWKKVVHLRRESQENSHRAILEAVQELANSCCQQNRYEEAERQLREVINLKSELDGPDHESTLDAILHLAQIYTRLQRYDEAETEWRKVIALRGEREGRTCKRTRKAEESLARMCFESGRYPEAEEIWRKVANGSNIPGGDYENALDGLMKLAHTYTKHCWYTKAAVLWNDVIRLRKVAHGLRYGGTLDAMTSLAKVHANCMRYNAAEALLREVIIVRNEMQGRHHNCTFRAMVELARMYAGCKWYDEAEAQWKDIIALTEEMVVIRRETPENHAKSFLIDCMKRFAEMEHWNNETLKHGEIPWLSREDPEQIRQNNTLDAIRNKVWAMKELAEMYAQRRRYADAETEGGKVMTLGSISPCQEVFARGEKFLGLDHHTILNSMEALARIYKERKQYREAEAQLKEMIPISAEVDGFGGWTTRHYREMLAEVYEESQDYTMAEAILVAAIEEVDEDGPLEPVLITQQSMQLAISLERVRKRIEKGGSHCPHKSLAPHSSSKFSSTSTHYAQRTPYLCRTLRGYLPSDAMFLQTISCFGLDVVIGPLLYVFF